MRTCIVFLMGLGFWLCGIPAEARTWSVRANGSGDVPTIQDACDIAQSGDDILVYPGTYFEGDIRCKGGVLIHSAAGPMWTRIDASSGEYGLFSEEPHAPWVNGFTIFGSRSATISVNGGGSQAITHCIVYGGGAGIYARDFTGLIAYVTAVMGDGTINSGSGISLSHSDPNMHNCICAFNEGYGMVEWAPATHAPKSISCCCVYANQSGNFDGIDNPIGQCGNISLDPQLCDLGAHDFGLLPSSPCGPYSPPNTQCQLIGALPIGCMMSDVAPVTELCVEALTITPSILAPGASARIAWQSTAPNAGVLRIVDGQGRTVRRLPAPPTSWDGRDDRGVPVPAGLYYGQLQIGDHGAARALLIMR